MFLYLIKKFCGEDQRTSGRGWNPSPMVACNGGGADRRERRSLRWGEQGEVAGIDGSVFTLYSTCVELAINIEQALG